MALSEYSAGELAKGNRSEAVRLAMEAIPGEKSIWNAPVTAQARKALTDALGVYELSDRFQPLDSISLSGSPYSIKMSPDGTRLAVVCQQEMVVYDLESGENWQSPDGSFCIGGSDIYGFRSYSLCRRGWRVSL